MAFAVQVNVRLLDAISPKLKKIERGFIKLGSVVDRSAEKMKTFGRAATSLGSRLSLGVTAPILALAAVSFRNFGIQADAIAQVEAGIASTGGTAGLTSEKLQELAISLQEVSVFGDEEILRGVTAQLLTFTNLTGPRFIRAQQAILDVSTKVGTDLTSTAIQLGKALNDPIANLGALGRVGIQFSEVQKELIKSLSETGQIAEAQSIILTELENQYGGAAKAAAEAGLGPFKQLINSMNDMTESFGGVIAEGLLPFVRILKPIVKAIESFPTPVKALIVVLALMVAALGPMIFFLGSATLALSFFTTANLLAARSAITMGFGLLKKVIPSLIGYAATMLSTAIPATIGFATALFATGIPEIVLGVTALIAIIVLLARNFDSISATITNALRPVLELFDRMLDKLAEFSPRLAKIGRLFKDFIVDKVKELVKFLGFVSDVINSIIDKISGTTGTPSAEAQAAKAQPQIIGNALLAPSKIQVNQNIQITAQFDAAGTLVSATVDSDSLGETKIETVNLGQITPVIL